MNDLLRLCARFWWGSTSETRKLYWGARNKLCHNKDIGGLGFRGLMIFNKALLAKQGGRLIQHLHSLAARVLKQCYYPDTSMLFAVGSSSSSFLWKSVVWGRQIIEAGYKWRIGNDLSVRVYSEMVAKAFNVQGGLTGVFGWFCYSG
ncbi:hypothetical protein Ddye_011318 [Dipteronia dyeriana]|uniref:Reverse transcriptase n=1 Tax=Dipteronia dyeriana TaxID=168575 RepID=A0AAE0CGT2_9ROSI|nr:hypothetical protein Ddye_011318 [Dipteronia dyeriana]